MTTFDVLVTFNRIDCKICDNFFFELVSTVTNKDFTRIFRSHFRSSSLKQ